MSGWTLVLAMTVFWVTIVTFAVGWGQFIKDVENGHKEMMRQERAREAARKPWPYS